MHERAFTACLPLPTLQQAPPDGAGAAAKRWRRSPQLRAGVRGARTLAAAGRALTLLRPAGGVQLQVLLAARQQAAAVAAPLGVDRGARGGRHALGPPLGHLGHLFALVARLGSQRACVKSAARALHRRRGRIHSSTLRAEADAACRYSNARARRRRRHQQRAHARAARTSATMQALVPVPRMTPISVALSK